MRKFTLRKKVVGAVALSLALMGSLPAMAMAAPADSSWIQAPTSAKTITANDTLLTTYGVRAGSAGGDYLGISNTNFDFTSGGASSTTQFMPYKEAALDNANKARLAIFGSDINENPNPYLYNLFYNANGYNGSATFANASTTAATSWMNNPHSWGDTAGAASKNVFTGSDTVQGAEFGIPDIIYGATDKVCWGNFSPADTVWYTASKDGSSVANGDFTGLGNNATYVHNDSTNVWTQIYTMGQLASTADNMSGTTRYGKAVDSAVNYEKAIKGNVLYVASKIDSGTAKKKVAYLYAIDGDASTAYFFTPEASKLTSASNTGKGSVVAATLTGTPSTEYGANNATVSIGYMDVLPFITDTYNSGNAYQGTIYNSKGEASEQSAAGIAMAVENYVTMSPACTLNYSTASNQLKDVDVIIYNTSTKLKKGADVASTIGTSGGKNLSGIANSGDYANGLTGAAVEAWAKKLGFTGKVIGGDDYGTSTNQPVPGTADAVSGGAAPMLYCQRNYTADRDSRAAWAISQVYPELYGNNSDATYGYWVNKVYHVKTASVPAVVQFMTNDSTATTYTADTAATIEKNAQAGFDWWTSKGSKAAPWSGYAYYNGSTRASFIDTDSSKNAASEEPKDTIGIFAPSALWTAAAKAQPAAQKANPMTVKAGSTTVKFKTLKKKNVTVTASKVLTVKKAQGTVTYAKVRATGNGVKNAKITMNKSGKITLKKGAIAKGKTAKIKVKVTAAGNANYKSATKIVTVKIKAK